MKHHQRAQSDDAEPERVRDSDRFFDVDYDLPQEVARQKLLTVKFVAKDGLVAGGVYDVRVLKEKK